MHTLTFGGSLRDTPLSGVKYTIRHAIKNNSVLLLCKDGIYGNSVIDIFEINHVDLTDNKQHWLNLIKHWINHYHPRTDKPFWHMGKRYSVDEFTEHFEGLLCLL